MNLVSRLSQINTPVPLPLVAALATLLVISCWSDLRSRRIPNQYVLWGLIVALTIRLFLGVDALVDGITGALLMFLIGFLLFLTKGFGGGDAKLLIAVGAFMGLSHSFQTFAAIAIAGMLQAVVFCLWHGALSVKMYTVYRASLYWISFGRKGEKASFNFAGNYMPYAIAIALGSFYTLLPS